MHHLNICVVEMRDRDDVRRETKKQAETERDRMSANSVLHRLSLAILSPVLSSAAHTHTHSNVSSLCPTCPFLHEYPLSSIFLSVSLLFPLCPPSPISSPLAFSLPFSLTSVCQSSSFPPFYYSLLRLNTTLSPSARLLFIYPHSLPHSLLPSLPLAFHLSLPLTMRGVMEIG